MPLMAPVAQKRGKGGGICSPSVPVAEVDQFILNRNAVGNRSERWLWEFEEHAKAEAELAETLRHRTQRRH